MSSLHVSQCANMYAAHKGVAQNMIEWAIPRKVGRERPEEYQRLLMERHSDRSWVTIHHIIVASQRYQSSVLTGLVETP